MANNDVKLRNGPGTSSSGGIKILDLNSLEDDLFGDLEDIPQRGIVEELKSGFMSGFLGSLDTRRVVTQFVKSAAPDGFSRLFGAYDSLMASVGEVKDHVERTNSQDLLFFANKTNSLLPFIKDKIPAGLYDNISATLEAKIDDYKYATDNNERNTKIRRARETEERKLENENNLIKEALDHNSLVTRTSFVKQERGEIAREARRVVSESIRDNVERNRFDFMAKSLSMSVDSLTKISAYHEQVDYGMKRKGLELQFRTYLGLKDSIKVQSETYKLLNEGLQAVVRNTALPDHKKKNQKELNQIGSIRGKAGKLGKETLKSLPSWLAGYRGNATKRTKNSIGSTLGNAANALRMGEMVDLGEMWDNRYSTAGSLAGDWVGETLTDTVVPWAGRKIRPELERAGDAYLGGRQHQSSYILDNIPALLSEYVSSNKERGFLGNNLKDFLEPLVPRYDRKSTVEIGGYNNLNEMAAFNEITQRSIVDVIPGYLSRILHELRIFRTGDGDLDREVYDVTSGKFTGSKVAKSNLLSRFISSSNVETTSNAVAEAISVIDPKAALSEKARAALSERLVREANSNTRFDPERYASRYGYSDDTDVEVIKELNDLFKGQFQFNKDGDMLPTTENFKTRNTISDRFLDIKSSTADPAQEILRLIESGNTEMLRDMGIIESEHGVDKINYKRIWDILGKNTERSLTKVRAEQKADELKKKASDVVSDTVGGSKSALSSLWKNTKKVLDNPYATINEQMDSLKNKFTKETPQDLWSPKQPKGPLIKGYGFTEGTVYDYNTGHVVESPKDITGPLVDANSQFIATASDLKAGIYTPKGEKLDLSLKVDSPLDYKTLSGFKRPKMDPEESELPETDWFLDDPEVPTLTVADLHAGKYFDAAGKVIRSFAEIKSSVYDGTGTRIVDEGDLKEGLWNKINTKRLRVLKPSKLGMLANAASTYMGTNTSDLILKGLKVLGKTALGFGISAFNTVVSNRDAYFRDSDEPVVTKADMLRGLYYDDKGKVIESFGDVYGNVRDEEGNILVDKEKASELINIDGSKHQLARNVTLIGRTIGRASKWYAKKSKQYMKWASKKALGAYKWGFSKIPFVGKYFKDKHASGDEAMSRFYERGERGQREEGPSTSDHLLHQILGAVQAQIPEKVRVGSWKDQLAKKKDVKDPEKEDKPKDESSPFGFLKSLKSLFLADKEDDDDYSGSDALRDAAAADSLLGGDKSKGKTKKPKGKPKGKFSKLADGIKKSRVGRSKIGRLVGGAGKLAMGAGRLAVGGAVLAGKGALALASVASAPVVLGTAAIIGAGTASYYGYKYLKNRAAVKGDIRQLRMLQYGITSYSEQVKILGLEDLMETLVSKGPNPTIKMNNVQVKEIFKAFDVDPGGEPKLVGNLIEYFEKRFKPVFLRYISTLDALKLSNIKINEIDEKLPDKVRVEFVTAVTEEFSTDIFAPIADPFSSKGAPLADTRKAYQSWLNMILMKAKKSSKESSVVSEIIKDVPPLVPVPGKVEGKNGPLAKMEILETGNIAQTAAVAAGILPTIKSSDAGEEVKLNLSKRKLDVLKAIRFRAYGIETLLPDVIAAMSAIEDKLIERMITHRNGPRLNGVLALNAVRQTLGLTADLETKEGQDTFNWIRNRLEPTLVETVKLMQSLGIKDLKGVTKPEEIILIAKRIIGGGSGNLWTKASIFPTPNGLPALRELAKLELATYEKELKQLPTATNAVSGSSQIDMQLAAKAGESESVFESIAKTASSAMSSVKEGFSNLWNKMTGNNTGATVDPNESSSGGGNASNEGGESYSTITKGNGGQWEKIPYPTANRSAKAARPTLEAVSKMTGVPAVLLHIFASMESSFDYTVKAKTSTATGWFQFLNKTWDQMIRDHGSKFNLPPDNGRKLRLDPRINALMGAMFLKGNANQLRANIGREPNDVDLYCAHFMGGTGASKFLRLNPNSIAATGMPAAAKANKSIYYLPSGKARTVAQVYKLFSDKVAAHRKTFDGNYVEPVQTEADKAEVKSTDTSVEETDVVAKDTTVVDSGTGGGTVPPPEGGTDTTEDTGIADSPSVTDVAKDPMTSPMSTIPGGAKTTVSRVKTVPVEEQPANTVTYAPSPSAVTTTPVESNPDLDIATRKNELHAKDQQVQNQRTLESLEYQRMQLEAVLNLQNNLQIIVDLQTAKNATSTTTATSNTGAKQPNIRKPGAIKDLVSLR